MFAYLPDDVLSEFKGVLQNAVLVAKELDVLRAHHICGVLLFYLSGGGQLLWLDLRI